jgi:hypothetical protein
VTATPQGPFNLSASSSSCTSGTNGLTCSFSIDAPIGSDVFVANTYSGANATGSPLGSGAVALTVAANATNAAGLTLTGPIASAQLFSDGAVLYNAAAGPPAQSARRAPAAKRSTADASPAPQSQILSSRLFVAALDVNGNQIINPTTFDIPLTVTLSLNGLTPGVVQLENVFQFPAGTPSVTTQADGGTVTVTSPGDVTTLSLTNAAFGSGDPSVTLSYTPQAGPNAGTLVTGPPISFSVDAAIAAPVLSVTTSHTPDPEVGQTTTVTNTIGNSGNAPTTGTITVSDLLTGFSYVSAAGAGWSCSSASETVTCTNPNPIAAGASSTISYILTATSSGPYANTVTASGGGATSPASSNTDTITVAPTPPPIALATTSASTTYRLSQDPTYYVPPNYVYDLEVNSLTSSVETIQLKATFQGGILSDTYDSCATNFESSSAQLSADFPLSISPSPFTFGVKPALVGNCYFTLTDGANNVLTVLMNVNNPSITVDGKARAK